MLIRSLLAGAIFGAAIAAPAAAIEPSVEANGQGGGAFEPPRDELTAPERSKIVSAIAESRARLIREGKLAPDATKTITNFKWPLRSAAGRTDFDYHGISNFVDEDPTYPNHVLDYFCGARSYDLASGYNHAGTDIYLWPFSWKKMDDEDVVIAAGAPGTIVYKSDGHFDRSCAMNNNTWNAVYVQHADGSIAWYGHMKNGTPTVKAVGETVKVGEYLGSVGSSGSSTGPHLHLELYDAANALVDPWIGACNSMSKQVTWETQRAYRDTAVNALTIGNAAPVFPACSADETSGAVDIVTPGTTVYFTMYLRDQVTGSPASMRVLRPNGTVYTTQTSNELTSSSSYWYWFFNSFPNTPGTWTFEVTIAGKTVTKTFQVGGAAAFGAPATITTLAGSAQTTPPSTDFSAPLRVQVLDSLARPVNGARVVFTTPSSGATAVLESRTALTDATGTASVAATANATAGSYVVTATVTGAAVPASIALQNAVATNPPRLANISTRMQVLTGNDVMIGGFVIGGAAAKTVAIVATGPSLVPFGIANALANPTLQLVRSSDQAVLATNDDWQSAANAAQLTTAGFAPSNTSEAAILTTLAPGAYTAIVSGVGNGTGVGVVAVYEVDHTEIPLINISTRGRVLTGNDVMIGGFVVTGSGPQTVAIVATGPSLAAFGIASPLANPTLTLVRSSDQAVLATNDDWQSAANAAALQTAGFAPSNPLESAILVTLPPGAYTAILSGVSGGTGVGVIGVYTVP